MCLIIFMMYFMFENINMVMARSLKPYFKMKEATFIHSSG
jgi:hypothetical protein